MTTFVKFERSETMPSVDLPRDSSADFRDRMRTMTCLQIVRGMQSDRIVLRNEDGQMEMLVWNKMNTNTCTYLGRGENDNPILPKSEFLWCLDYFRNAQSLEKLLSNYTPDIARD